MKRMSQENEREFEELTAYVSFYATHVWNIPLACPHHLSHFMTPIPGKVTKAQLLVGVRQAANDTVESAEHLLPQQITALDIACTANSVLTFSEVRRRFSSRYKAVLRKRCIRDETDYYMAVGVINDMTSAISPAERHLLQDIVVAFEQRIAQRGVSPDPHGTASLRRRVE